MLVAARRLSRQAEIQLADGGTAKSAGVFSALLELLSFSARCFVGGRLLVVRLWLIGVVRTVVHVGSFMGWCRHYEPFGGYDCGRWRLSRRFLATSRREAGAAEPALTAPTSGY